MSRLIIAGFAIVLLFDAVAATASRMLAFPYIWASIGSLAIYLGLGMFAVNAGGMRAAALVGMVVGAFDATVGELVSRMIGPVRAPLLENTLSYRALVVVEVMVLALITSCIGGLISRWTRGS